MVTLPASGIPASAPRSSLRELMSSLVNTLRRWYSTVRGLMNSLAPISGFVCLSLASRAICASWGVRTSRVSTVRLRRGLAGGQQLAAGALGERLGADPAEAVVGGSKLLARVDAPVLAAQPFAVEELGAGEVDHATAAREPLDRLAVEGLRSSAVAQQRA